MERQENLCASSSRNLGITLTDGTEQFPKAPNFTQAFKLPNATVLPRR